MIEKTNFQMYFFVADFNLLKCKLYHLYSIHEISLQNEIFHHIIGKSQLINISEDYKRNGICLNVMFLMNLNVISLKYCSLLF